MNSLIFSNSTGEILSNPQEEKREQIEDSFIVVRYYQDNSGWRYSIQLKLKRLIRTKPCLKTDKPLPGKIECVLEATKTVYSWMNKKQKHEFQKFTVFDWQQPMLFDIF